MQPAGSKPPPFKIPESVLVVIHTPAFDVLLLERADAPGFWQSVTGSRSSGDEPLAETCRREVEEETGWRVGSHDACLRDWQTRNVYEIHPQWRRRYAPEVTHNTEHVFALRVPTLFTPTLAPREHVRHRWLGRQAAAARCSSATNAAAILRLTRMP